MDITLRQLEIFSAVARSCSFTGAANELLVSQPAISRTVTELERKLHAVLLVRTTRSVELTEAGEEFFAVATEILEAYRRSLDWFADYQSGRRGQVTVATLPSVAAVILPAVVAGFLEENPGVQVRLVDGTSEQVLEALRDGSADFAIAEVGPASAGLSMRPLLDDPLVAVLPRGHALADQVRVAWTDLAGEPFIAFGPGSSIRRLVDLGLAQAGVEPRHRLEAGTVATAGGMISAGLGVSAIPELALALMPSGPLVTRPLGEPSIRRRIAVHQQANRRTPETVQRLIDRVVAQVLGGSLDT
ncbi:LysR substrate-binding domain-containing protein [Streptomyces sp. NPDC059568]|uniref:LysR family transcriptional regulator n=1 Tax=unclassified Streptomyces TaxID=2593676 RepID=UPI00365397E0